MTTPPGSNQPRPDPARRPDIGLGVRLVHEDQDVVVVEKPPGIVTAVMPGTPEYGDPRARNDTVFGVVKWHVRDQRRQRGTRVWIIHRLDKEASGLLVFAASERAYEQLKEAFRTKRAHRLYTAVVEGTFDGIDAPASAEHAAAGEPAAAGVDDPTATTTAPTSPLAGRRQLPAGTIRSHMIEGEDGLMRSIDPGTIRTRPGEFERMPQMAVTHWRAVASLNGRTLVQVRLDTGRKNQIRVHMKESGHPLVGDRRYGGRTNPINRLCLHAGELGFHHPATGEMMRFFSPPPAEFFELAGTEPPKDATRAAPPHEPTGNASGSPIAANSGTPGSDSALRTGAAARRGDPARPDTSWDHVADWYDRMIGERRSDHYERVILPGTLRLLGLNAGQSLLDVACGQGVLASRIAESGVTTFGVDASERLVESARRTSIPGAIFEAGDARDLLAVPGLSSVQASDGDDRSGSRPAPPFDAAACIMALMNIDPIDTVARGVRSLLKPGGAFVAIILHPAFRSPGQTSWGWDESESRGRDSAYSHRADFSHSRGFDNNRPARSSGFDRPGAFGGRPRAGFGSRSDRREPDGPVREIRQYRRVDGYLSPGQMPIVMNPGYAAHGQREITTWTFHRPIQTYVQTLADAGFWIDRLEEWPSARRSEPGPRAAEENRARREIPMFLAIRAIRRSD